MDAGVDTSVSGAANPIWFFGTTFQCIRTQTGPLNVFEITQRAKRPAPFYEGGGLRELVETTPLFSSS